MIDRSHFHPAPGTGGGARERADLDPARTWNLEELYRDIHAWEEDFALLRSRLRDVDRFRGTISSSGERLLEWLRFNDAFRMLAGSLGNYAFRRYDEDTRAGTSQAMMDRILALEAEVGAATAWVSPELLEIPDDTLATWLERIDGLAVYAHYLDDIRRAKAHVLSPSEERILALSTDATSAPSVIFGMFNDADIEFGTIEDEHGNAVELTKGRYLQFMESPDRRVREDAFRAMYSAYARWKNTLSATLNGQVKRELFHARVRGHASSRDAALFESNIPASVYDTAVASVNAHLEPLHRAIELRRRVLGLDAVRPWDLYVPLAPEADRRFAFEDACAMVMDGLSVLGSEYSGVLRTACSGRWIDVYETPGKCSGAYSAWTYGTHPFILLNYTGTLNDVFTLAHELGHALHSWFTWKSQPPVYGDYSIFCAEVASTCNEMLLLDALRARFDDLGSRINLLMHAIETIRGTMYNQILFAEFEQEIHARSMAGDAPTADAMSGIIAGLYQRYYGPAFDGDPLFWHNWSRIPHFYRSFYVYQYATGLSAAIALSSAILRGEQGAADRYRAFLRSGRSGYSINLLRDAGVDMTTAAPFEAAASLMSSLMDEAESLLT